MSLDTSGALLEGLRLSGGNNTFTFPPRSLILPDNDDIFNSSITDRIEYLVLADSLDSTEFGFELPDPNLIIRWSRNESKAIRFDYDSFNSRWLPLLGAPPESIDAISNDPRLLVLVPDLSLTNAPFSIYVGSPVRVVTFTSALVTDSSSFTAPGSLATGTVEISQDSGELNFSTIDLGLYAGQEVIYQRQGYFDRTKSTGEIGVFPESSAIDFDFFLNPKPATGDRPRIRIGFRDYLTPIEVSDEASFSPSVSSGDVEWSLDTGKLKFSSTDVDSFSSEKIYYDGVFNGSAQFIRTTFNTIDNSPFVDTTLIDLEDPTRFIFFAEKTGEARIYFKAEISGGPGFPPRGSIHLNNTLGRIDFNLFDENDFGDYVFAYIDSIIDIEKGTSVQFFRSGANSGTVSEVDDLTVKYAVEEQLIQDGITLSPTVFLPTVPIDNDVLEYEVGPGTLGGTFVGVLKDGSDPSQLGIGFLLDLDARQLEFSERKILPITLPVASSIISLEDQAISLLGFEVERNNVSLTPGVEFDFTSASGTIEFTSPVGESDPDNKLDISGTVTLPSIFTSNKSAFDSIDNGKFLFIESGDNQGLYLINGFLSSLVVRIALEFSTAQSDTADIRQSADTIADRIWKEFLPPFKDFSVERDNATGTFRKLDSTEFSVLFETGQVNLNVAALPDEQFIVNYIFLQSDDEGVTTNPTPIEEPAFFPIRQELAATSPNDSKQVKFNPDNRPVPINAPLTVFVDGIVQGFDQGEEGASLVDNQTIQLNVTITDQIVTVNYNISEAFGGETSFTVTNAPVELDLPTLEAGETTATFNEDQTGNLPPGSPMLIDRSFIVIVEDSTYDAATDLTTVTFRTEIPADSVGNPLFATDSINSLLITETAAVDTISNGTNFFTIAGNQLFKFGMIVFLDDDAYSVEAVSFDEITGKTTVNLSSSARRNYILPAVKRTVRPIFFPEQTDYNTSEFARLDDPITVVRMGPNQKVLEQGVDFSITEGGAISLTEGLVRGNTLFAMYVSRVSQPAGTSLLFNFARTITPVALEGQRLFSTYNLFAPDSFFFSVETVESFFPEVVDFLEESAQPPGISGPNIEDAQSIQTKDAGFAGLFFEAQRLGNFDEVFARLLKVFNDIVNAYEDVLANIDGRVVGGADGKFRFDGNLDNPERDTIEEVTNDIDDQILIREKIKVTGGLFNPPVTKEIIKIFAFMWKDNRFSRIFPTTTSSSFGITGDVSSDDRGEEIGSTDITNITSASTMQTTRARAYFTLVSGNTFTVEENGNVTEDTIPPFRDVTPTQIVEIRAQNGALDKTAEIVSIGINSITLDKTTNLIVGTLQQNLNDFDNDEANAPHAYTIGRDIDLNFDNGQVINRTFGFPLDALQETVTGSELLDIAVTFRRPDLDPLRIPALDGALESDNGFLPSPLLRYANELVLLGQEQDAISRIGNGTVLTSVDATGRTILAATVSPIAGQRIQWTNGPNAGEIRTVLTVNPPTFTVNLNLVNDPTGSDYMIFGTNKESVSSIISIEKGVIENNQELDPLPGAVLGLLDSELKSVERAIDCFGTEVASGTGTAAPGTPGTLTDLSANFVQDGVVANSLVFVPSGENRGLYLVATASPTIISLNTDAPFADFPAAGSTPYEAIIPFSFLGTEQFGTTSSFMRETLAFLADTITWESSIGTAGSAGRLSGIAIRISSLGDFITLFETALGEGDNLYDTRFLWIKQRTDKTDGTLRLEKQALEDQEEATQNLIEDQQKLLIAQGLET